jgi:hypothetical protein
MEMEHCRFPNSALRFYARRIAHRMIPHCRPHVTSNPEPIETLPSRFPWPDVFSRLPLAGRVLTLPLRFSHCRRRRVSAFDLKTIAWCSRDGKWV